ncbi:MAG: hypothetical protein Ta2B_21530 [Termitinemataceae bacterium]|nr:MAG: hypothetical protein Ta2B_21530 [Termitinemataceae bacterium]
MSRPDKARETLSVFTDKATGRGRHKGYIIKKIFTPRQNPTQSCVPLVFRSALSINNFYKAFAYLYLYKSFENIDITDMTLTFSVSHYPREVINHLQNVRKLNVTKKYNGIYYVTGDLIPIQFIGHL